MSEKELQSDQPLIDLDPRIKKQVEKARKSVNSGSSAFAIEICMGLVEKYPGCVEAREVLRHAQRVLKGSKKKSFLSGLTSMPLSKIGSMTVKKDPAKAMIQAEKILRDDPGSTDANKLLAEAARLKELPHTAIFAMEDVVTGNPKDTASAKKLAELYLEVGRIEDCVRTCERILRETPGDGEAQEIIKRASVTESLNKGKWEEEGDYRDKLKDKSEAESPNRPVVRPPVRKVSRS